ncbi:MAG: leucyl aminopeptidase [Acidimicrobiales bacterium]|nr:leucyl aminopeptidase [Acidimicrobiales bacterium]
MTVSFSVARKATVATPLVAFGLTTETLATLPAGLVGRETALHSLGFEAKVGQVQVMANDKKLVAAVGLGSADDLTTDTLRSSAAALARAATKHKTVACDLANVSGLPLAAATRAVVEGMGLAAYRFGYKSKKSDAVLAKVVLTGSASAAAKSAVTDAQAVMGAVSLARDLVNEPGGSLTAPKFANKVRRMAKETGLTVKVMDEAAIKRARLGGLLGVNRGSTNPPRFVELTYTPKGRATGTLALVGKGITFDTGGLSIKSGQAMMDMKMDMGGAAAVVGAMSALPALAPKCKVKAYMPMTDNMLGGDATRPGDVLTIRNGKTIEVLNTDAEGRLVLADALSLASEAKPDAIIDLATLTGACMAALGPRIAGLMGHHDGFVAQVEAAAASSGDRVWRLPLPADYRKMYDSSVADMKNIGGPYAGASTAGLILSEFVPEDIPWAHLDIAGPAFTDAAEEDRTKGGTGFGVRLLLDLIASFEKPAT